jgi:hypothetical protein
MNVPLNARPVASSYTPNVRDNFPVVSEPIGYVTSFSIFSSLCHARWTNFVSVLIVIISAPIFLNLSYCSARAANSVAQTNVKSAG